MELLSRTRLAGLGHHLVLLPEGTDHHPHLPGVRAQPSPLCEHGTWYIGSACRMVAKYSEKQMAFAVGQIIDPIGASARQHG